MKVFFDSKKDSMTDLEVILAPLSKFKSPLVVVPTEREVDIYTKKYLGDEKLNHVKFITYDYWLSKKWVAEGDFDNIDFFKIDRFLKKRSFGTRVGCATVERTIAKKVKEEENDPS